MIDTVLLIAIALLLVVVLVPVGIALYQRLKPSTDDRPGGGAVRPAPPPLPPPPPPRGAAETPPVAAAPPRNAPLTVAGADRTNLADPGKRSASTELMNWFGMLLCTAGPLEGQRFVIEEKGFYIGRDASVAQVVVNDSRISKRHVRIVPRGSDVWAIDPGSTNGTFVGNSNGQRITEVQLKQEDVIVLADHVATFLYQV